MAAVKVAPSDHTPQPSTTLLRRLLPGLPGLVMAAVLAGLATVVGHVVPVLSSLVVALLLGVGLSAILDTPLATRSPHGPAVGLSGGLAVGPPHRLRARAETWTRLGLRVAARTVLRVGVVLLGLRLSWAGLIELGVPTIALVVTAVVVTFVGTRRLGRALGLSPELSLLVAAGSSICGASAIAAVKETSSATEEEVAVSVSLVTACGTLALFALPAAGTVLGLGSDQLGTWLGSSIQDVAQVVAAGSMHGNEVLAVAIVVKLTRVALLAPLMAGLSLSNRRQVVADRSHRGSASLDQARPVPWFVVGFLAMMALRSSGLVSEDLLAQAKTLEKAALTMAMVGIGSAVRLRAIRRLGPLPLALGLAAWVLISAVSLLGILLLG